jgi:hypothetical protein
MYGQALDVRCCPQTAARWSDWGPRLAIMGDESGLAKRSDWALSLQPRCDCASTALQTVAFASVTRPRSVPPAGALRPRTPRSACISAPGRSTRASVLPVAACGRGSGLLVVLEVRPSRDVDTVVLGRRECPPMGHMRAVRQASARFECCRDSCFGLIGRHADVDVGPATPRLGRVEALERHVRVPSVPIDDVFFRSKAPVPEGCGPKQSDVAACILRHRDAHHLDLRGVRLDPQLPRFCRDLACQLDITMAQSSESSTPTASWNARAVVRFSLMGQCERRGPCPPSPTHGRVCGTRSVG